MMFEILVTGDGLPKLNRAMDDLGKETKAHRAYRLAINRVGAKAKTQVIKALFKQTGLKRGVIVRAIGNPRVASYSRLTYEMRTSGGNISLKHFGPVELRHSVRAKPFGKTQKFDGAFMKAGHFPRPRRVVAKRLGGNVFKPTSSDKEWGRSFEGVKSGVFIPKEMIKGATEQQFRKAAKQLTPAVEMAISKITRGVIR